MSELVISRSDRRPVIRFPRPHEFPPGSRVEIYWNGSRAVNGDGVAGAEGEVKYDAAIAGPLDLWPPGTQRRLFGGGFARAGFGEHGARPWDAMGFGRGPFGVGAFGVGGGVWEWKFPFALRDGLYRIDLLLVDVLGNRQPPPGTLLEFVVAAPPRPPANIVLSLDDDDLVVAWEASPDLE